MKLLIRLYKNEIAVFSLIISLMLWGLVTSYLAFKNNSQVILIGKTGNSYQLITDEKKRLL